MSPSIRTMLDGAGLTLHEGSDGLSLSGDGMTVKVDFANVKRRIASGKLSSELLVKAAKVKRSLHDPPLLLDATAGLGEDSMLLSAAGFEVMMYERNPVIALLLADAVDRARDDVVLGDAAKRVHVHEGDSIEALRAIAERPDVVYLDPMFPERKKSAAVKKKFQLLHRLETPCEDEETLLEAAISAHPQKVVVKRPLKAAPLAGIKPSYEISGKAIRYDCIASASMSDPS